MTPGAEGKEGGMWHTYSLWREEWESLHGGEAVAGFPHAVAH